MIHGHFHIHDSHCIFISEEELLVCSIHGLIRGENMELGRDSDTGGQVHKEFHLSSYSDI